MTISPLLIAAIIMRECSGDFSKVGDDGRSVGPMGITMICLEDINRFAGTDYVSADRWDLRKSIDMFRRYTAKYATEERLGRPPTFEDACRIWNSGPDGWRKDCSLKYWYGVHTDAGDINGVADYMNGAEREAVRAIVRKVEGLHE